MVRESLQKLFEINFYTCLLISTLNSEIIESQGSGTIFRLQKVYEIDHK